jgi:DNA polymerase III subunit gamma/tau
MSLATKYRPEKLDDVVYQEVVLKILNQQIKMKSYVNVYMFSGPSGVGKTTIARILANEINEGLGSPIEIDAASNNGVDNIRNIIEHANERSFESKYKVYIIDECHMLTTQSWNALLKLVEEPPKYTIFMFCTTNLSKVPQTILNRCQLYKLTKIPTNKLIDRLKYICSQEDLSYEDQALDFITKLSYGSLRQAICSLELCIDYGKLNLDNVKKVLGNYTYDVHFELLNAMLDGDISKTLEIIDKLYSDGQDLKLYLDQFISFILDVLKFTIYKSYDIIEIPKSYSRDLVNVTNLDTDVIKLYKSLLKKLLHIKINLSDVNIREILEVMLINVF